MSTVHEIEEDETPCNPTTPCKADYQSDEDLCCAHGGPCFTSSHEHYDIDEVIDRHLESQAERRIRL